MQPDSPPENYIPNRSEKQMQLCVLEGELPEKSRNDPKAEAFTDCLRQEAIKRPTIQCDLEYYKTVTARLRRNIPNPPIILVKEDENETSSYFCITGMKVLEAIRMFIEVGSKNPAIRPLSDYRTTVWLYPYMNRKKLEQFAKWYGDSPA